MKKLVLLNHMGDKLFVQDVFVDGQNTSVEFTPPQPFWLGKILIVDKEPEAMTEGEARELQAQQALKEAKEVEGAIEDVRREEETQAYIDKQREVQHDLKTVSDKSGGDSGVSSPEQLKGTKRVPKKTARGKATKRSK